MSADTTSEPKQPSPFEKKRNMVDRMGRADDGPARTD
jgi:hypothetical protein